MPAAQLAWHGFRAAAPYAAAVPRLVCGGAGCSLWLVVHELFAVEQRAAASWLWELSSAASPHCTAACLQRALVLSTDLDSCRFRKQQSPKPAKVAASERPCTDSGIQRLLGHQLSEASPAATAQAGPSSAQRRHQEDLVVPGASQQGPQMAGRTQAAEKGVCMKRRTAAGASASKLCSATLI